MVRVLGGCKVEKHRGGVEEGNRRGVRGFSEELGGGVPRKR